MKDTDVAYIAGLIDGEAYIGIKKTKVGKGRSTCGYTARIQVRMVDEPAIAFLSSLFGSGYYKESPRVAKGRPLYCWAASNRVAERVLSTILPYLRVKKEQALTALHLMELKKTSHRHRTKVVGYRDFINPYGTVRKVPNLAFSDKYVMICEILYRKCKRLNRVGIQE